MAHHSEDRSLSSQKKRQRIFDHSQDSWSSSPTFDRFWQHYAASREWMEKHFRTVEQMHHIQMKTHNKLPPPPVPPFMKPGQNAENETRIAHENHSVWNRLEQSIECSTASTEVEQDEEIEMSEEMLAFFRKTVLHKIEREKQRQKEANIDDNNPWFVEKDEYISADKIGVVKKGEASVLPPDSRSTDRLTQSRHLYGNAALRINTMEMKMDMKFDEEFNRYNPPLWPNIPLKL